MSFSSVSNAAVSGRIKGTGRKGSKAQPGADVQVFWSATDFAFSSKSAAIDKTQWDAGVASGDLVYVGVIEEFDSNDTEATFYESANGGLRIKTAEAKRVRQFRLVESSATHAALLSLDGQNGRLFFKSQRGYLRAKMEGDTVVGLQTSRFDVGLKTAATNDTPAFTPIDITFANPQDDDKDIFEDTIDFDFSDVDEVFNIELKASSVTSNGSVLSFTLRAEEEFSDEAVLGLVVANLKATDANGSSLTIASVSANGDNYDVDITTALTSATLEIDDIQDIGSVLYRSEEITVTAS